MLKGIRPSLYFAQRCQYILLCTFVILVYVICRTVLNINCYESFHFVLETAVFWGTVSKSNVVRRLLSKSIVVLLFLVDVFHQLCSFK